MTKKWNAGTLTGLAVAVLGALGLLSGHVPRMYSGLIAIVAIGIIVAARRTTPKTHTE